MSTFGGIVSEIDGVSIDRFDGKNVFSRAFFLSHCHADHMIGLNDLANLLKKNNEIFIYMSKISAIILKNMIPALNDFIRPLETSELHLIQIPRINVNNSEGEFVNVTLIPAGHCPGSVMFLFKKECNKTILYTGDFRMAIEDIPSIRELHHSNRAPKRLDRLYFDSTFWNENYPDFPSRDRSCDVIADIIKEWIDLDSNNLILFSMPARYGSEYLYKELYKRLKMPIHVTERVYKVLRRIVDLDGAITLDPHQTKIHNCKEPSGKIYNMPKNCQNLISSTNIRHIRPSAIIWTSLSKDNNKIFIEESDNNMFKVCYSSHCSYNELKAFIEHFKPKSIKPCVVPVNNEIEFFKSISIFCKSFSRSSCSNEEVQNFVDKIKSKDDNNILDDESSAGAVALPEDATEHCDNKKSTKLSNLIQNSNEPSKPLKKIKFFSNYE